MNTRFALEGRDKLNAGLERDRHRSGRGRGPDAGCVQFRGSGYPVGPAGSEAVADLRGLDLRDEAQLEQAIAVVDAAYDRVAADYGVDDAIHQRAAAQRGAVIETSSRGHDAAAQIERVREADAQERGPSRPSGRAMVQAPITLSWPATPNPSVPKMNASCARPSSGC